MINPIAVFFEGDVHVAQRYLPYALHCCLVVDANKRTLSIATTTQDFPLPRGEGFVRVISLDYTTKLIIHAVAGARAEVYKEEPQRKLPLLLKQRLVWLPEGFVITPRSPSIAPDGWGLPDNMPGGPLREVIINRFEHNLYPDVMYVQRKDIANAKLGEELFSNYPLALEPAFYALKFPKRIPGTDINFVGIIVIDNIKDAEELKNSDLFIKQVLEANRVVIDSAFEQEQAMWFCHRPQLIQYLYSDQTQTAPFAIKSDLITRIFHRTNQIRAAAGKPPLYPPLRGWYTTLADSAVEQNALGSALAHGSSTFIDGYKYFPSRVSRVGADGDISHGENIAFVPLPTRQSNETEKDYQIRVADILVDGWVGSPFHYANIVADYFYPYLPNSTGVLELGRSFGDMRAIQNPPFLSDPVPLSTPSSGLYAAQLFRGMDSWVMYGDAVWYGDAGVVSWYGPANPVDVNDREVISTPGGYAPNYQCVYVKGHAIHVAPRLGPHHSERNEHLRVIAAGAFISSTQQHNDFYVVALLADVSQANTFTITYILTITPLSGDPIVLSTYVNDAAIGSGLATVSPNGRKIILTSPTKVSNNSVPLINGRQVDFAHNHPPPSYDRIGVDLVFMEFVVEEVGGYFYAYDTLVHRSSVTVNVEIDSYLYDEGGGAFWRYNYYKQSCSSTYRWRAAYDANNELVFADVELDILTEQSGEIHTTATYLTNVQLANLGLGLGPSTRNNTNTLRYKSKIKFPNGYEIQWLDVNGSVANAEGFILCFHYLDILNPTASVYTKLNLVTTSTRHVDAEVKHGGTMLFTVPVIVDFYDNEAATSLGGRVGVDILESLPFFIELHNLTLQKMWSACLPTGWFTKIIPANDAHEINSYKASYKAMLYSPIFLLGGKRAVYNYTAMSLSNALTPWIAGYRDVMTPFDGISGYIQVNKLKYKNEYITFIGVVQSATIEASLEFASLAKRWNPFGPIAVGYPRNSSDPTVFMLSSIDLKAITGVSDLSDNIYPLGVI